MKRFNLYQSSLIVTINFLPLTLALSEFAIHFSVKNQKGQRYDLTKWTYTQLRDYINTSTDIDMIQACRDEFARRLQAYHNWRAKVITITVL